MDIIEEATQILKDNKQEKVFNIFKKLDNNNKEKIANQILKIDFDEIRKLYLNRNNKDKKEEKIEPIGFIDKSKMNEEEIKELQDIGKKVIQNNKYAVVTMAGGQGTRLGWKGPKGTFKLDIGDNGKYIFEILLDTLKRAKEKYNTEVYWYIMTSSNNHDDTVSFFEENNYFGYDKEKIKFFNQSSLPLLDTDGNLVVDNKFNIREVSDGNGGIYKSLKNTGMLQDMIEKGVEWIYVCGVDNIMANMVDTLFLGLTVKNNMPIASKSVKKSYPEEKVGVFCKKNGKPGIQEYIDLDKDRIYAKNDDGELLYGDSNIVSHLFNIKSLIRLADYKLKYHCAFKKNSFIDENLKEIIPDSPNTYKFESFIFDGFEYLDDMLIFRVNREEEFAPIKNAEGFDSPKTAKEIYTNFFRGN